VLGTWSGIFKINKAEMCVNRCPQTCVTAKFYESVPCSHAWNYTCNT